MRIFICCKNINGIKKIQDILPEYYNLDKDFVVMRFAKEHWLYTSPVMDIHIICEQPWNVRGYRANLIYVQDTVSEDFVNNSLDWMLKPFIFDFGMTGAKIPCVPIQYFSMEEE